ncbi:hypothetical protein BHM03_00036979 [Ensete ventricosum]|nr:hypothetical protein BHM03_00036979 [Ensete ventricosum]
MALSPGNKLSSSTAMSGSPLLLRRDPFPIPSSPSSQKPSSALTVFAAKGYKMKTHKVPSSYVFWSFFIHLTGKIPSFMGLKASAKRFRVTGRGEIVRRRTGKQHLLAKKNTKRKLRLSKMVTLYPITSRFCFAFDVLVVVHQRFRHFVRDILFGLPSCVDVLGSNKVSFEDGTVVSLL